MKYFVDTEFNEGLRKPISILPTVGKFNAPQWGIELISIGIKCEDGRNYYAVSKDFDLKAAWNKYEEHCIKHKNLKDDGFRIERRKEYWLRDNVLHTIFIDLCSRMNRKTPQFQASCLEFNYENLKNLIYAYGKTNEEIAVEVERFCTYNERQGKITNTQLASTMDLTKDSKKVEFYGYYCAYDWVVLCGCLYGRMLDKPKMFPKHCIDVNQILHDRADAEFAVLDTHESRVEVIKSHSDYPRDKGLHHALEDAKWTYELYKFLINPLP